MKNLPPLEKAKDIINVWQTEEGWFHRDEAEDQYGPFETEDEANEALNKYLSWLNGENE